MRDYDIIIVLVGSPGSNVETGFIAGSAAIARKTQLFIDSDWTGGLAAEACRLAELCGAGFQEFKYPEDLVDCHLLGATVRHVEAIQIQHYLK